MFIFFHHCLDLYPGGGTMAVAFFFVLGGFSMTLGYQDKVLQPDFSYKLYLTRRFIKFYPLHWLCLLAILPWTLHSFSIKQIPIFFINASLLHTWIPDREFYFSFNAVSWYLADTMFFTVVFPFVFKWIVGASLKVKGFIAFLMTVVYVLVAVTIPEEMYHAILYISPYIRLMDFVFGILLALSYLELKERQPRAIYKPPLCYIVIFSLIVLLVVESCLLSENARLIAPVYWIPVALVIIIASLSEQSGGGQNLLQNKYLLRLGELSFIIFMIHQIILRYCKLLFYTILHLDNDIVYVVLTLVLTILLSLVVEKYLLNPITKWLTKRIQPSMTVRS
jgi:peptidoglycan/LPS O-acetylase OafA/YrhL